MHALVEISQKKTKKTYRYPEEEHSLQIPAGKKYGKVIGLS